MPSRSGGGYFPPYPRQVVEALGGLDKTPHPELHDGLLKAAVPYLPDLIAAREALSNTTQAELLEEMRGLRAELKQMRMYILNNEILRLAEVTRSV